MSGFIFSNNGQRVATRVDGTLYYVHQDHLGSTVAVSDEDGVAMGRVQYDPYGEVITSTLPVTLTDQLFTGQRFDSSTGLYYYNARYYDPYLGRFIQPDTLVPDPFNPQAWNRFSYVYNNPVSYVDPGGHFPIDWLLDIGGLAFDVYQLHQDPSLANWGWLALDVALWVLPFVPAAAGALAHADEAADLARAAGRVEDVGDAIRYAPRSSGHHRALQRAIVEGLEEGEIVAFRGMDWGWGTWARKGYDIPFKPHEATWTWMKGPKGLRLTNAGVFLSDLDAMWALDRRGMMILDEDFMEIALDINRAYGKDIVLHGTHWQGMIHSAAGAVASFNNENYLMATVYIYGKNINGVTGFLGSGPALDMYRKYRRLLHP